MKASFQEALREIKNRVDILSVISKHINVKKAGSGFVSVCPFHNDKSPSLHISPTKGIFKCFACGASGDLFKFLVDYKKISFSDAVHELAEEIGIEIVKRDNKPELSSENELILKMNEFTTDIYHKLLTESVEGQEALKYLKEERRLNCETIKEFKLGYSSNSKTFLLSKIQTEFSQAEVKNPDFLINSGLFISDRQTDLPIDRFRGRLMVPIYNYDGGVIAFGARTLDTNVQPKYLNSPETPVYHKSRHLYGLHKAKDNTRQKKKVLLLEGYFDVIQAHQNGINYAVGSLGTALTKEQASLLYQSTLNKKIILGFDNDDAGQRALKSSLHVFQEGAFSQKMDLKSLTLEKVKDIDEYLINYGSEELENLIESSPSGYSQLLESIVKKTDLDNNSERSDALNEIVDLIFDINDPIEREILVEQSARLLSFSKSTIMQLINKKQRKNTPIQSKPFTLFKGKFKKSKKPILKSVAKDTERTLVSLLLLTDKNDVIERIKSVELKDELALSSRDKFLSLSIEERKKLLEDEQDFAGLDKLDSVIKLAKWNKQAKFSELFESCLKKILGYEAYDSWQRNVKNKKANLQVNEN
ncbi:MAG: DNA primase [Candidatus Caenarcaniphilales bacterium]|nr:DNA primase [Candidatus Caenarcaniphilales bacterium]